MTVETAETSSNCWNEGQQTILFYWYLEPLIRVSWQCSLMEGRWTRNVQGRVPLSAKTLGKLFTHVCPLAWKTEAGPTQHDSLVPTGDANMHSDDLFHSKYCTSVALWLTDNHWTGFSLHSFLINNNAAWLRTPTAGPGPGKAVSCLSFSRPVQRISFKKII